MEMVGVMLTSWPRMLDSLKLMVRPKSLLASAKELVSRYKAPSVCSVRGSVVCKQHQPDQYFPNLGLRSEACKVEEVSIASGVTVHTTF